MEQQIFQILLIIISGIVIPGTVPTIIGIYKTTHIKTLFKRIDDLQESKAEKSDFNAAASRLHDMELKIAENFGRFESGLSRFESIEKRFEEVLREIKKDRT